MNSRSMLGFVILLTSLGGAIAHEKQLPPLRVTRLKAEASYMTDGGADDGIRQQANTWGIILQIIDDDNMLVGIDNGAGNPGGNPRYSVTVWCKFPTKGMTDGKTGFLANILGTNKVTVTGTTRYKTSAGASRTVFVLAPLATKAIENPPQRRVETAKNATQLGRFVGRWKLVDEKGVVSSFLTVTKSGAMRDHAPDSPGTWEVVGNEARIKWDDGFRDILRLDKQGKMTLLALQKAGPTEPTDWSGPPRFSLQAIQIPKKQQPSNKKK